MKLTLLTIKAQDHAIKSVTIFKSCKAEIDRVFSVNLNAGQTKVDIEDLPGTIDTHSVRVSGLGGVRLSDVACTIGADNESSDEPDSSSELIRLLMVQKQALEKEKYIRDQEAELLMNYAKTLTREHVTPTDMSSFLEDFVDQGRLNIEAIAELRQKILAIDRQIETEKGKKISKTVSVILGTDAATTIDLKLTYIVSNVHWSPTYELHTTTENGKPSPSVTLKYRARVCQSTGEDWKNAALILNTISSDLFDKQIPQLQSIKLAKLVDLPMGRGGGQGLFRAQRQQQQQTPSPIRSRTEDASEDIPTLAPTTEPSSSVAETPIAISYSITGVFTIPSDGVEHQVSVAVLPFDATIFHVTTPRIDPCVYLQCQVKNTSDYKLFAGPVSVILNGSYVSMTSIPFSPFTPKNPPDPHYIQDVDIGDGFECTLGDDPAVKVTCSRTSSVVKNESEATQTASYMTKITVHNKHTFVVPDLVVRNVIPTCDDERVKVLLQKPESLANMKDGQEVLVDKDKEDGPKPMWEKVVDGKGGEKEGKFQWKGSVKAKDKLLLEAQWDVEGPADVTWFESILRAPVD